MAKTENETTEVQEQNTTEKTGKGAEYQALVKTELISKDLMAAVQKKDGCTYYAIFPSTMGGDKGLSLNEAINQIADFVSKLMGRSAPFSAESIEESLNGLINTENIILVLRQAYLFARRYEDSSKNTCEYAFNIAILTKDEKNPQAAEGSLFKLKELSFAVWSCDREMILDSMDIVDFSDIDKAIEHAVKAGKGLPDKASA